jgi:hypothetical protein
VSTLKASHKITIPIAIKPREIALGILILHNLATAKSKKDGAKTPPTYTKRCPTKAASKVSAMEIKYVPIKLTIIEPNKSTYIE